MASFRKNTGIPVRVSPDSIGEAKNTGIEVDVDAELAEKRKRRAFSEEGWFYNVKVGAICICAIGAFSVVVIYIWHLLATANMCWLSAERLSRIENVATMIVVGVIGTLSAAYFFKR